MRTRYEKIQKRKNNKPNNNKSLIGRERERQRDTDRQKDRQKDRQTERQTTCTCESTIRCTTFANSIPSRDELSYSFIFPLKALYNPFKGF